MKPIIGISAGDPAGIGLEVTLKALPSLLDEAQWILFADSKDFVRNLTRFSPDLDWREYDPAHTDTTPGLLLNYLPNEITPPKWGHGSKATGKQALLALEQVSAAALRGLVGGIVTAPVNKQCIGKHFLGQTDFLAVRANIDRYAMSFFTPTFKVVLATRHLALKSALEELSIELYLDLINLTHRELGRFGSSPPRIALAGVNPHAGEGGLFGREESEIMEPAVRSAQAEGIQVIGPFPADSLYYRAHMGEFDVVIAPYHDQALIPVKLLARYSTTNVTLGLPYIRTSPDHGTAFDIAGSGEASFAGMLTALETALHLIQTN